VSIGHATQYVAYQGRDFWQDPLFKAIYIFHMPLFMAIAGYVSFRGITGTTQPVAYMKDRAISYLMPIFSWAALFQVTVFLLSDHASLKNLPFAIAREAFTYLWFIWVLLGSICLTVIAQVTGKYRVIVLLLLFLTSLTLPEKGHLYLFHYTFPFFVAGFFIATFDFSNINKNLLKHLMVVLAVVSCLCFFVWEKDTYIYVTKMSLSRENLPNVAFRWLAGSIVSAFVMLFLFSLSSVTSKRLKGIFILAGQDSIYIYILQEYAFRLIEKLSTHHQFVEPAVHVLIKDAIAIIIGSVVAYFCWCAGRLLAREKNVARILFGKVHKAKPFVAVDSHWQAGVRR
jgi:fucose 4-O-acetylase-like acetyltransferase